MITGGSAAALSQTTLLLVSEGIGGIVSGLALGIDEMAAQIDAAIKQIQANRANRGKEPLQAPHLSNPFRRDR